jgi:predicted 3-demethylubiquinone-9 3-methyltransferase (glyoxalase superfamily)
LDFIFMMEAIQSSVLTETCAVDLAGPDSTSVDRRPTKPINRDVTNQGEPVRPGSTRSVLYGPQTSNRKQQSGIEAMKSISTFLMFSGKNHGQAKAAMDFYVALFPRSSVERLDLFGPDDTTGSEGTVRTAVFYLNGTRFMAFDSAMDHAFNFTPSVSMFVDCDTEDEITSLYNALSADGGQVLMALDNYGFSLRFGWVNDRFGVSWQLNQVAPAAPAGAAADEPVPTTSDGPADKGL